MMMASPSSSSMSQRAAATALLVACCTPSWWAVAFPAAVRIAAAPRSGRPAITERPRQRSTATRQSAMTTQLNMSLVPLTVEEIDRIISTTGKPTAAQCATYWGRTKKERYGRFVESAIVGFLGVFFSYFMSFVIGGFVATVLGCVFFFWGILSPELKAYQRNWEFLGGRPVVDADTVVRERWDPERAGLYGALFLGRIADVCVVEDANDDADAEYDLSEFSDYTMETDEMDRYSGYPYLLRVQCADRQGRTLQIHCRLAEDYLHLRPGMPATTLLLSTSPDFTKLAALTDVYALPTEEDDEDSGCWIGDYPYLERAELEALLAQDDDIWDALQDEALEEGDDKAGYNVQSSNFGKRNPLYEEDEDPLYSDFDDDDDDSNYDATDSQRDDSLVPVRKKGRG